MFYNLWIIIMIKIKLKTEEYALNNWVFNIYIHTKIGIKW